VTNSEALRAAVDAALAAGASYAEARAGRETRRALGLVDGGLAVNREEATAGVGVRVLVGGGWGFAASASAAPTAVAERAVELARASAKAARRDVALAPVAAVSGEFSLGGAEDPASVSHADRLALLEEVDAALALPGIVRREVNMELRRDESLLVTSDGSEIHQTLSIVGGGLLCVAQQNGTTARRSYPHHGGWSYGTAGFEWFEEQELLGQAPRIAREALLLLDAEPCPRRRTTVILDPMMIGTLLHETVGHATELDRALGEERENFGATFAGPELLGHYPYASPAVTVTADATYPGGAGSYVYDAEGAPAERVTLIERGTLQELATSRECAAELGRGTNGAARASSWNRIPMARITNLVLEPGAHTLESLMAGVDDGVYVATDASTDIDDNRELCAFGGEIGWRIRHGELAEPVSRPIVYGDTHSFLRNCDGVGSPEETRVSGIAGCGKGQPWQFVTTGQGGPPARFRDVEVGWEAP
jgi:TldD protein